jgi:diguanylate cyclase (GGDEF)-like protein
MALDLDGFRLANDSLGPSAGDELLRQAGGRLSRAAPSADLVARRSADEFLVLITDLHDEPGSSSDALRSPTQVAREVAHSLQVALVEPLQVGGNKIYLGACVGIATVAESETISDPSSATEQLLSEAQYALSGARASGPGSVMTFDSARPDSRGRLSLVTRLRQAVDRREFMLYYQPTVDLHSGRLTGVEALLRWNDPTRGIVAPGEFIDVAEETGLIEPIGEWILGEVCRQRASWRRACGRSG